jgi:PAS domain S-box-containing protein
MKNEKTSSLKQRIADLEQRIESLEEANNRCNETLSITLNSLLYPDRQISEGKAEIYDHPVKDKVTGEIKKAGAFIDAISQRNDAEKELLKSKNKYHVLIEQSSEMLFLHDVEGRIIEVNRAAEKNTQYSKNELCTMNVMDLDPDARERDDRNKYWRNLPINDESLTFETRHQRKDGSIYPVEVVVSKIELENEKYIMALARDITERRQAGEKIRKSEARQSAMIANIADVLAILDENGIIQYKSPNIERLFGWKPQDLVGQPGWLTVHPDDLERIQHQFSMILRQKGAAGTVEYRYRCKDDTYKTVQLTAINLLDDPNVKGILTNYHDISEQKRAEEELKNAKEKAEESDRLKSAFLANMSHEIRTPMNGIMGFAQILQEKEYPRAQQKKFLNIIHSRTLHLMNIINDLIDISKIEAGQLTLCPEPFYLNELISQLNSLYKKELESRNKEHIQLNTNLALDHENSVINADPGRFRQIMENLLYNAVKFTSEGSIEFGYELQQKPELLFYVKDTGIGIPGEKQEIIFERFRQADDSTRRVYEGTGLGLTISKNLVEAMGGKLWLESGEGKGSVFYFTLPFQNFQELDQEEKTERTRNAYDWKGKNLLIIEDDMISREYMREILKPTGAELLLAANGTEGINAFESHPNIDLVLLDIRLPDISGMEVAGKLKEENKQVPIIAQTAHAMGEDRKKCIQAGADDYIAKPADVEDMLSIINKYI